MASLRPSSPTPSAAPNGFIIVAVLWMLGALAALASIYALYVVDTATAFAGHRDRLQAEALTVAGLELTAHMFGAQPPDQRSTGAFSVRLGAANVTVHYASESGRIDLNAASSELLGGLFSSLGAVQDAGNYAERIVEWRSSPANGQDPEGARYRNAGLAYGPRGAAFPHVAEVWLLMGLPEVLLARALPYLTVYSAQAQVNIFAASPTVLAALPGMSPERLHAVLAQRAAAPQDAQSLLATLGPVQQYVSLEAGATLRVAVHVVLANGRRMSTEAVILVRMDDREPYRILSWQDEMDVPPDSAPIGRPVR